MKVLFLCTGNFYRSRLAEELLRFYSEDQGIDLVSDSAALGDIPNPINIGPISQEALRYLGQLGKKPEYFLQRYPKKCTVADIISADIIIGLNEREHKRWFEEQFPDFTLKCVQYWHVPDVEEDPDKVGPELMDKNVRELLKDLSQIHSKCRSCS
ncbi:MAG: low molecular weight phosphatase family protein [Kiritimatiellae bacterium]|nr:low molecular weight phosphatase family protein [Kiritimatiellia bacterium]MDD5521112.1 low molecular weight phosphatase family protein [Kiritimatiellia bacterium]